MAAEGGFELPVDLVVDLVGGFDKALGAEMAKGVADAVKTVMSKLPENMRAPLKRAMDALEKAMKQGGVRGGQGLAGGMILGFKGEAPKIAKAAADAAKVIAEASVKAEVEATKRMRSKVAGQVKVAKIQAPAKETAALAEYNRTATQGIANLAKLIDARARDKRATFAESDAQVALNRSRTQGIRDEAGLIRAKTASATQDTLGTKRLGDLVRATARLTEAEHFEEVVKVRQTKATAAQTLANTALDRSNNTVTNSTNNMASAEKRLQSVKINAPIRKLETTNALERSRLNKLRVDQETSSKQAIEAARRQRQIDVAETQQDEKRKTLRLQRFNAIFQQLTQAGLVKIRDMRRIHSQQDLQQQQSHDRAAERQLKETLSRRESTIRTFETRTLQRQASGTQRAIDQRTSTGVLGAARGASPLGASLRSLAFIGGGALSIRAIYTSAQAFLTNFRRLGAITGATDTQLKQLRSTAIALGNDLSLPGVSAGDATEALTKLVQAGFSVDQAIGAAKGTLLLARNNTIDFAEAAQFTGSAINAFGIDASQGLRVVDVAQKSLISGGGQSFGELQQAIQQSGAVFAEFFTKTRGGLGAFEDMNIALDILAKNGLRGSDAGTSLKTFLIGTTGPSEAASKKIGELSKELGVAGNLFFDAAGNARPFIDSIKNLRESMAGLTQEQKLQELKLIFGTDAFRAAAIFIGQTDAELVAFEKTIRESAGSSEALGKAVNQGMKAAFDNFSSVIETAGILLIEKIDKPLGKILGKFAELTSSLLQGSGIYETIRKALVGIGIGLAAIVAAKGAVEVMGLLKASMLGFTSPAGAALLLISGIGAALGIGVAASDDFRAALGNLASFIKTNVLGPLGSVVGGLFGTDKKPENDPLKGRTRSQIETLPDIIGKLPGAKTNAMFDTIARTVNATLIPALQTAVDFIKNILIPAFGPLVRYIDEQVLPIIGNIGSLVASVARLIASEFNIWVMPTFRTLRDGFRDGFSGLTDAQAGGVIGFFQDVARSIGGVASALAAIATGNFSLGIDRFVGLGKGIAAAISGAVKGIDWEEVGLFLYAKFKLAIQKLGSAASTIFSEPFMKGVLIAGGAIAGIALIIASNFITGFIKGLAGRLDDIQRFLADTLGQLAKFAVILVGAAIKTTAERILTLSFSGPLGAALAAAFVLSTPIVKKALGVMFGGLFKPLVERSKAVGKALTGDAEGAIKSYSNFRAAQSRTAQEAAAQKQALGGGFLAGFLTSAEKATTGVKKIGTALDTVSTKAQTFAGRIFGAIGEGGGGLSGAVSAAGSRIKGAFNKFLDVEQARRQSTNLGAAISAGFAAGLGGFFAATADTVTSRILGIGSLVSGVAAGFAAGGAPGAAFAGIVGGIGVALGLASKKAEEARARVKAFTDALKAGQTAAEGFATGIEAIVSEDKGLQRALAATGLTSGSFLSNLLGPKGPASDVAQVNSAVDSIQKAINAVDVGSARAQLLALGDALPVGFVTSFTAEFVKLKTEFDNTGGSVEAATALSKFALRTRDALLDAAAGASGAGAEIAEVIQQVRDSLAETSLTSALSLDERKIGDAFAKVKGHAASLSATLVEILPTDLELQFQLIASQMGVAAERTFPNLGSAISGTSEKFDEFKFNALNAVAIMGGTQAEAVAVETALNLMRDGYLNAGTAARSFNKAAAQGVARQTHLDRIAEDWGSIEEATREAQTVMDIYFAGIGGGTAREAVDEAILGGQEAIKGFTTWVEEHPGVNLLGTLLKEDPTDSERVLQAQINLEVLEPFRRVVRTFIDKLPDEIKGDKDKTIAAVRDFIGPTLATALEQGGALTEDIIGTIISEQAILDSLQPARDAATKIGEDMVEAIEVALRGKPLSLTDLPIGSLPELPQDFKPLINATVVLEQIQADPTLAPKIKEVIAANSTEAIAVIEKVSVDQAETDAALETALLAAEKKLPPIKVNATVTSIAVQGGALRDMTVKIGAAAARAILGAEPLRSAEGRIATSSMVTTVGEAGPEAIIPLTKPKRALQLMRAAGLDKLLLGGTMGSLKGAGRSVGEGAALGISEASGMVAGATAHLAGVISSTFTRLLGIHSPSTLFEKYGKDIIEGLMKGLKEGAQAAGSSIRDFINIFLGTTGTGGAVATGIDQLLAETKKQLVDALKELGDTAGTAASSQSGAFSAIADFAKGAGASTWKDKKGKIHKSKGKFAAGFDTTSAAGAENRSALLDVISSARDAIVEDIASGDTAGAQAVFKQLQAALKKAGKAKKGNQAAIDEILGDVGLGGVDPLADIMRQFTEATEEMRRLTEAEAQRQRDEDARKAAQRETNRPPTVNNNFQITSPFDPFEIARRTTKQQELVLSRAWQE